MAKRRRSILHPRLFQRMDRWILMRAPLFWRTRLLHILALLVLPAVALWPTQLGADKTPWDLYYSARNLLWWIGIIAMLVLIAVWIRRILRYPVGEIALRRHGVTLLAVAVGSYFWLLVPSVAVYLDVKKLQHVPLAEAELALHDAELGRFNAWQCMPPDLASSEMDGLREVLTHYYGYDISLETVPSYTWSNCDEADSRRFTSGNVGTAIGIIDAIRDARTIWEPDIPRNQFAYLRHSVWQFLVVGLLIGVVAVLLSYPRHVWRRRILRR